MRVLVVDGDREVGPVRSDVSYSRRESEIAHLHRASLHSHR